MPFPRFKLTPEQVADIQRHPAQNVYAAARAYGVSRQTILWHLRKTPRVGRAMAPGRPFGSKARPIARKDAPDAKPLAIHPPVDILVPRRPPAYPPRMGGSPAPKQDVVPPAEAGNAPAHRFPPAPIPRPILPAGPGPIPAARKVAPKDVFCEICGEPCIRPEPGALQLCVLCNS